ncbi:single insulin-like growth factor-binding domain protein-2 [Oratosquilla oratoria]|uniref:single insulin-like growth factor-binding domain protein-2 n=1 Tax=Oratosquilla oratoria TaxID=337810 RepID=UPI003F7586DB
MPRSTSTLVLLLALLCIFVSVKRSSGLSCPPCENRKHCPDEPSHCDWGFSTDECGCCIVCRKGPGTLCSGIIGPQNWGCTSGLPCLLVRGLGLKSICDKVPLNPSHPDSSEEDNSFSIESNEG